MSLSDFIDCGGRSKLGMKLTYAQHSSAGPVRPNNEDWVGFWEPEDPEEFRTRGAVAALADGVGGHGDGEIASRLAVEVAIRRFLEIEPELPPRQTLAKVFTTANIAVYDRSMFRHSKGRMATTLTISLFRGDEVTIGHVGDGRVYLVGGGQIEQVTSDHNYAAAQIKLGVLTGQEAAVSEMRCVLTRCVGKEMMVQPDFYSRPIRAGSYLIQCSDGLYIHVSEQEIQDTVSRATPAQACRQLVEMAEQRGTDDNLSIQVIAIEEVPELVHFRGATRYKEPPARGDSEIGQVLDDRFELTDVLSRSGMASIFKGIDRQTGSVVAIKVPFMQFESDPAFFTRFQREEEIGKLLNHPFIMHIVPVDGGKSRPYMVMEYLDGQTLRQYMRSKGRVSPDEALQIASRICDALSHMHEKGIVHRDLKPENVMLCRDGSLRIMDFGIAKAAAMRRLTFAGFSPSMGTPDYMAPEQVKGKRGDERTDIYALGAILYEMVTGSAPFEGANPYLIMNARLVGDPIAPRIRNLHVPPGVEEIILHAMDRDPRDRYQTAGEMKADLDHPEQVPLTGRHERLRPHSHWQARWRRLRTALLMLLVPVIVFGFLFWAFYRLPPQPAPARPHTPPLYRTTK
jgi:serine/threonine protein phosphatase PrpC